MPDLRLDADFFDNVKTQQLHRRLGDAGVLALLRLWCYTRRFRPTGELTGMNAEKIAIAARWEGDDDQLIRALSELIFIERSDDGQWQIHDWATVNEWAAGSEGRRRNARKLNHKRWYVDRHLACPDLQCVECEPLRSILAKDSPGVNQSAVRTETIAESPRRDVKRKAKREMTASLRLVGELWNALAVEWQRAEITDKRLLGLSAAIRSTEVDARGEDSEFSWEALFARVREQSSYLRDVGWFDLGWIVGTKQGQRNALKVWRRNYRDVSAARSLTRFPVIAPRPGVLA